SAKNTYKSMLLPNGNSIDFIGLLRLMYNDESRAWETAMNTKLRTFTVTVKIEKLFLNKSKSLYLRE
ncbi:MAG: hypothetical protein CVV06_12885, partial [Gammaproteobacteria bacterium HGW-Gammaproteobacteria-10]